MSHLYLLPDREYPEEALMIMGAFSLVLFMKMELKRKLIQIIPSLIQVEVKKCFEKPMALN
jgi:hypothetical protein